MSIAELCAEHRALEAQVTALLRAVAAPMPDADAIGAIRTRLAQAIGAHCEHEDREVYERLMLSGDRAGTVAASRYRRESCGARADFSRFVQDWPIARVAEEWEGFGVEAERVAARLATRMLLEERVLFSHVERVAARRAAAG